MISSPLRVFLLTPLPLITLRAPIMRTRNARVHIRVYFYYNILIAPCQYEIEKTFEHFFAKPPPAALYTKKTERGQLAPRCRFCDLFRLNDPDRDRAICPCPSMTIRQVLRRIAAFNPKYHRILRIELPQFLEKPHLATKFEKPRKI